LAAKRIRVIPARLVAYILGVETHTVDSTTRNFLATALAVAGVSLGGIFFLVGALSLGGLSSLGRPRGKTSLSQIKKDPLLHATLGNPLFRTCVPGVPKAAPRGKKLRMRNLIKTIKTEGRHAARRVANNAESSASATLCCFCKAARSYAQRPLRPPPRHAEGPRQRRSELKE
jgi:hypothetical protein